MSSDDELSNFLRDRDRMVSAVVDGNHFCVENRFSDASVESRLKYTIDDRQRVIMLNG